MQIETLHAPRRSTLIGFVAPALLLTFAAWAQLSSAENATPSKTTPRAQLCVASATSGQNASGKMRDFELLRRVCRRSGVYEQKRTSAIYG
jgi:hypothetical protein